MKEKNVLKKMMLAMTMVMLLISNSMVVFASEGSGNYAENGANWFLGQLFWVALVVVVVVVLTLAAKRNFTGAVTSAVVGAIVVYFIKNPKMLENIGNSIMGNVMK